MRISLAYSVGLLLSLAASARLAADNSLMQPGPKSPAESLACLKARTGFTVEFMAAEPLVMSPVAFAWGPDGKFWVVEMGDYPLGVDGKNKFGGKVKFLEKSTADGPYDKATLFLDNLGFPTGVTPWGRGVIVTCAPDIFYAEYAPDKSVKKTVLFTGFKEGNQQHRVNGLVWGLDNWLYGANGESGGAIKSIKTGALVNISGRDFRIKADEGLIEAVSGVTQFGRARDDWGNWFGNNNSEPMYHFVLEDRYLRRNPHVIYPSVRVQVSQTPGAARVYPISKGLPRFNSPQSVNHFTSACSAIVYRDDLFGPDFVNNTFVSEPVHNLVHREIMTGKGVTFTSKRAADEQTSEFLASSDNWFRPTTIRTGPDGALWVADMYRYVIEHPEWIPKDWQNKLDLRAGADKGRIYRVYPTGKKPRAIPRMDTMTTEELVKAFDFPSGNLTFPGGWQLDMAQQLLVVRKDASTQGLLRKMLYESRLHLARLHAMAALSGRSELTLEDLKWAMRDEAEGVRANALLFSEPFKAGNQFDNAFQDLLGDLHGQLAMQLAYSLGESDSPRAGEFLGKLAALHVDPRMTAAILSSVNAKNWPAFLAVVLNNDVPVHAQANLTRLLTAFGSPEDKINFLANRIHRLEGKSRGEQFALLATLLDGFENIGQRAGAKVKGIETIIATARAVVADPKAPPSDKLLAIGVLNRETNHREEDRQLLSALLVPQVEEGLQSAAVQSLGKNKDPRTPGILLKPWKSYSPVLRVQVVSIVLSRPEWTRALIDALESKQVLPTELDVIRRQQLLQHKDQAIRQRAERLLAMAPNADRDKLVRQYLATVPATATADLGKKVFTKQCAACHQLGGVGQQVGPDLASVPDKSHAALLTAILDPNRNVEARYVNYLATTKAGLSLSGVLYGETTTSITLVAADGKKHELLRRDLDDLASTGKSPMPEGFEKEIPAKDMADLIAFLRAGIPDMKPKQLAGNRPGIVKADDKGVLRLLPKNGSIYGKTLVMEEKHGNLGYWSSEDDHAVWTLDVPAAATYVVEMEAACADGSAGNIAVLQVGPRKMSLKIAGTGTWDDYRVLWLNTVQLPQGRVEVSMRAEGPIRGALIDLKGIYLVPKK